MRSERIRNYKRGADQNQRQHRRQLAKIAANAASERMALELEALKHAKEEEDGQEN